MSIATQHDYAAVGLPRDEEGPVFDKPWQAKAFSLIVHLHRAGLFPWAEWVRTFSEAIKAAPAQPGVLANASCPPAHNHHSLPLGVPVTVSPAQYSISQINNGVTS